MVILTKIAVKIVDFLLTAYFGLCIIFVSDLIILDLDCVYCVCLAAWVH